MAPPVGLDDDSLLAGVSLAGAFSFSPAAAPPWGVASLEPPPADDASLLGASLSEELVEALSPAVPVEVLVDVVDVDVVWTAALSALVSVGGVISGELLGTASETLLLPHALSVNPANSATHAASATRALTADPFAFRRWGNR